MNKQKDYIADIMQQWYDAMDKEKVGVQPKCATILGTIMSNYKITLNTDKRDIWAEAMTTKGGDFPAWYDSLNAAQKKEYEVGRRIASDKYDDMKKAEHIKTLLKG